MPAERSADSTWAQLRRRKVVQWGLAYAAAAWALLQVFGFAADSFGWPATTKQLAMLGFAAGLPIAVVLAWFHGDRGQQRVTRAEFVIVSALVLLGVSGVTWWARMSPTRDATTALNAPPPAAATDKSIAVLPFDNMSSDPEQEYFSDGVAEQVLDQLSRVPDLRVIARASSFTFRHKDADIATVAQRLHVSHVLEGSVRKAGNRVRITAQLIRTRDSSQLWSETYDRELTDVFAIQDEIAAAVVQKLKATLLADKPRTRSASPTLDAYNLYLQGRYLFEKHGRDDMEKSIALLRRAVDLDPEYAPAWAALAQALWIFAAEGYSDVNASAHESVNAAQKALALDPQLALAHSIIGNVRFTYEWDWPAAAASFSKALECDSNDSETYVGYGLLALGLGHRDEAVARMQTAANLSPVSPSVHIELAEAYAGSGRGDDAEREIRTALELSPEITRAGFQLGVLLLLKGDAAAALGAMQRETAEEWRLPGLALANHALRRDAESDTALKDAAARYAGTMAYQIAEAHAYRGEADAAFAWLERAYRQRDTGLAILLKTDPLLANVRHDPRYGELLRKMNLPPQ